MSGGSTSVCVDDQTLAAFACGGLVGSERQRVEDHLSQCSVCLAALAAGAPSGEAVCESGVPPALLAGRFEVGALIARGGMGAVYRGQDQKTGRVVAIKRLEYDVVDGVAELRHRFEREGEILRQLDHPNIVKMLCTALEADRLHLVMEYVPGGSLRDLVKREKRLAVRRALQLALELSDALARAHHLKVIHRDIKPENILIAEDGTPRLSDFGLARAGASGITRTGTLFGTVPYQSPEALWGNVTDERADIWAFGVTLFEVLGGQRPFTGFHPGAIITAILHQPTPDLSVACPDAPAALVDLLRRMLDKSPQRRVGSIRQVGAELEALLRELPDPARTPLPRPSTRVAEADVAPRRTSHLPDESTRFIGRESELLELSKLLAAPQHRLITIRGAGGAGKTRLAFEAARRLALGEEPFRELALDRAQLTRGVFVVDASENTTSDHLLFALVRVFGLLLCPSVEARRQLVDFVRDKSLLLLLDGLDSPSHGGELLSELSAAAPEMRILATSRGPTGLAIETCFALSGLGLRAAAAAGGEPRNARIGSDALRLFVEYARRVCPEFALGPESVLDVPRICEELRGNPLGIVLAASTLDPAESEASVRALRNSELLFPSEPPPDPRPRRRAPLTASEWSLLDAEEAPPDELSVNASAVRESQRRLSRMIALAWSLLDARDRDLASGLAIFRGGFTLAAAQTVAGASSEELERLLRRAVLRQDAGAGRYFMPGPIREEVSRRLATVSLDDVHHLQRHARYFTAFLEPRAASLLGPEPWLALEEVAAERANLDLAWRTLVERCMHGELRSAAAALHAFHVARGSFAEAEAMFGAAAAALRRASPVSASDTSASVGQLLSLQALQVAQQARHAEAIAVADTAIELLQEGTHATHKGQALLTRGSSLCMLGRVAEGMPAVRQALGLLRTGTSRWELARSLSFLGAQRDWIELGEARAYLEESLVLQRSLHASGGLPQTSWALAAVHADSGENEGALGLLEPALQTCRSGRDRWSESLCLQSLATIWRRQGKLAEAEQCARGALTLVSEYFPFAAGMIHALCAEVLEEQGRLDEATTHCRRAVQDTNSLTGAVVRLQLGKIAWRQRQTFEAKRFWSEAIELFDRLRVRWGILVGLDHLGMVACQEEEYPVAEHYFQQAAALAQELQRRQNGVSVIAGIAHLLARSGESVRAAELASLAHSHPAAEHQTKQRRVEPLLRQLAQTLPAMELAEAAQRGARFDLDRMLSEIT
jgi:predicted ATPase/predicted Ser/Thr protein kinase